VLLWRTQRQELYRFCKSIFYITDLCVATWWWNKIERVAYVVVVTVNSKSTCRCDIFRSCHDATYLSKQSVEVGEAIIHRVLFTEGEPTPTIDGDTLVPMHPDVRRTVTTKVTRGYVAVSRVFVPRTREADENWLALHFATNSTTALWGRWALGCYDHAVICRSNNDVNSAYIIMFATQHIDLSHI